MVINSTSKQPPVSTISFGTVRLRRFGRENVTTLSSKAETKDLWRKRHFRLFHLGGEHGVIWFGERRVRSLWQRCDRHIVRNFMSGNASDHDE